MIMNIVYGKKSKGLFFYPCHVQLKFDRNKNVMSFSGTSNEPSKFMDLVTDTSFSGILDETSKSGITIDPGLTTPPIRSGPDHPHTPPMHSPPVRSLFRSSPAPESQWLNGDVSRIR